MALALLCAAQGASGSDWPQFRGPNGDGTSSERIQKQWSSQSPRPLWRKPLTSGFSSFAISQGRAYTLVRRSVGGIDQEVCVALNADTGAELWARALGLARYDPGGDDGVVGNRGGDGPRSTPTVRGDRVFVLNSYLVLSSLNAATGEEVWSKDLPAEYGGSVIPWQSAASPLIEGDLLFVNCNAPSRRLLALRPADGSVVWQGQDDKMTQATPVASTLQGVRQIIFMAQSGLVAVAPETGSVLWRYKFPYSVSTGASPVVAGDIVYCSAAYNIGAAAVRVTKSGNLWSVKELWRKPGELMNHWSTPVHHNGYLYGLYGHGAHGVAPLQCVNLLTGEETWSHEGFGPGGVLWVDGLIMVLSDAGTLVLVQPDPTAYTEVARFKALTGKCWNVPAVCNGRIYARSTKEGVALEVPPPPLPALRLSLPQRQPDGAWRLQIACADGSPIDATRAARIELRATTNVAAPTTDWVQPSLPLALTNGALRLEQPAADSPAQRYFIVLER
jgi:outer membrane protein assembly factor BamB